jgi:hypothetical protein
VFQSVRDVSEPVKLNDVDGSALTNFLGRSSDKVDVTHTITTNEQVAPVGLDQFLVHTNVARKTKQNDK